MRASSVLIVFLIVLMTCTTAAAQEGQFGGGGGPMPALFFLDLGDLNAALTAGGYPQAREVLFAMGGAGFWGALDGIRVGGLGVSGDGHTFAGTRSVSLDFSYGGMLIEKAAHTETEITVVLGTLLGFGTLDLQLIQDQPTSFQDAVNDPFVSRMSKNLYAVQPYIAFESRPSSWLWARLQLGFFWALSDRWTFEEIDFSGPPRTLQGIAVQLMLRFGGDTDLDALEEQMQSTGSPESAVPEEVPMSPEEETPLESPDEADL